LEQGGHVGPELAAGVALGLGQFVHGALVTQASKVSVFLPLLECLRYDLPGLRRPLVYHLGPRRQVGPQPVERLFAETDTFLVRESAGVLALAGPC
jgi:hypothetical protein